MFDDEELPAGVTWERKKVQKFRMEQDRLGEEGSCVSTYRFSYPPSVLSLSPSYLSLCPSNLSLSSVVRCRLFRCFSSVLQ